MSPSSRFHRKISEKKISGCKEWACEKWGLVGSICTGPGKLPWWNSWVSHSREALKKRLYQAPGPSEKHALCPRPIPQHIEDIFFEALHATISMESTRMWQMSGCNHKGLELGSQEVCPPIMHYRIGWLSPSEGQNPHSRTFADFLTLLCIIDCFKSPGPLPLFHLSPHLFCREVPWLSKPGLP